MNGQGVNSADLSRNQALKYLALVWNRKWLVIVPALLGLVGAVLYSLTLTDHFRSQTFILVTPQKVPEKFVSSTVTTDIQDRLNTIRQQLLSRTRLEQIINEFDLFSKSRADVPMEVLVASMRKSRIEVKVHRGRGTQGFEVSYIDSDPQLAMRVTNKLASLFIEENLKVREQQAMGTSQFLEDEISRYREDISVLEQSILEYKRKFMHELPELTSSNQARLSQLQSQLEINSADINAAESRRLQLQQQMAEIEGRAQRDMRNGSGTTAGPDLSISEQLSKLFMSRTSNADGEFVGVDTAKLRAMEAERAQRQEKLEALLLKFTERHPEVVSVQGEIARLDESIAAERTAQEKEKARLAAQREEIEAAKVEEVPSPNPEPRAPPAPRYPPIYDQVKSDLLKTELEIQRLSDQNKDIHGQVELYQRRLAATPVRELELRQLSQDYDGMKATLERLVSNKMQADLSENLERKQKGEQFKILDPASFPEKPVAPNRQRIVIAGFIGGSGLGLGVILLIEFLVLGVRSREELAEVLDVPVLGVVSQIVTAEDTRRRRRWQAGLTGAVALCGVLAVGVVHVKIMPLPEASSLLVEKVKNTHWTTIR